jgi:hypothetical protein
MSRCRGCGKPMIGQGRRQGETPMLREMYWTKPVRVETAGR